MFEDESNITPDGGVVLVFVVPKKGLTVTVRAKVEFAESTALPVV